MSNFAYKPRPQEAWDKRAKGSLYEGFALDEFTTYTPKKDCWIRILPPTWENPGHYGLDLWVHYGVGPNNATIICQYKMQNKNCPICEAFARAEAAGREDANQLKPTRRVLVWLVDRKEEAGGKLPHPLLWAMPWTVDRDISKICRDRMSGELYMIDHPDQGYDVTFDKEGEGVQTKYTGFQLARKPTPVDQKYLNYAIEHPLPTVLLWRDYETVKSLFEGAPPVEEKPIQGSGQPETPAYTTPLASVPAPVAAPVPPPAQPFVSSWLDQHCSLCGLQQFTTVSGHTCASGHGGAPSQEEIAAQAPPPPPPQAVAPPPPPPPPPTNVSHFPAPSASTPTPPPTGAPTAAPAPTASRAAQMKQRFVTGTK